MEKGYLQRLDGALAAGAALLNEEFARKRAAYVESKQMPGGGFAGRRGRADIYYTDFALRTLALLAPRSRAVTSAAPFVNQQKGEPKDIAECFNRLNCARILKARGVEADVDAAAIEARLAGARKNAYDIFLAALCCEMLGTELPGHDEAIACISAMRRPGGGFTELPGEGPAQSNPTAAAVNFLMMAHALAEEDARAAAAFLAPMQAPGGGFLAHKAAPEPDLLSTFTALVTLSELGALDRIDLADVGRFVRSLATEDGGFRSCDSDPEADVEYTCYGVGAVALLRSYADVRSRNTPTSRSSPA